MAANSPTQLPAYIQLRLDEGGTFDKLYGAGKDSAQRIKREFNSAFTETEKTVSQAVARISSKMSGLDLGVGDLRNQSVQLRQYRDVLALVGDTAEQLARETGDTTTATNNYVRALKAQASEAGRALDINEQQIKSMARLQAAVDKASASARTSIDTRSAVQRLVDGDAAIHSAALSGATLENVLGRVANKGKEVKAALEGAAKAAELAARNASTAPAMASAAPTNSLSGVSALVAGQASIDRAAVSGTTLEQVLGRVSVRSEEVAKAQKDVAISAAAAAKEQADFALAVDRLNAELDPTFAAEQRLTQQQKLLNDALAAGVIDAGRHAEMMRLVANASYTGTTATKSVVNSQRSLNMAMLQSGQQLQDIAVSLYSGQRAAVVFAQQLPQLAFALTYLEGSANKTHNRIGQFATFLSGPWGLAVGVAVGALVSLATEYFKTGDESDKATQKTYDFSTSLDVLTLSAKNSADAMKQLADASRSAIREQGDFLDQQAAIANASVASLEKRISDRQKQMNALRKEMDTWTIGKQIGLDASDIWRGTQFSNLKAEQEIDRQALADARLSVANTNLSLSQRRVADNLDATTAATDAYKIALGKLSAQRTRSINMETSGDPLAIATSNGDYLSADEYEKRLTELQKTRDAALKAAADAKRTGAAVDRQFGREINSDAAQSIASAAGFKVTSANRTRAEQQWLYDNKRTPTNPVALPGTSAHEKGNALDIAFGSGVSANSIKKAYADAGVRLTKILKEDGHFHIEWSTSGADKAQREADALVKKQQELEDFGHRARDAIESINGRFADQPRLIGRVTDATNDLDAIIRDLQTRQPPGFEDMIKQAQAAKATVQDALVKPFRQLTEDSDRRLQIQKLLASGQQDEADALQEVWRMTDTVGDLNADQTKAVRETVLQEKERTRELQRQQALFEAQIDVLNQVKSGLTDFLSGNISGKSLVKSIQGSLKELQGKRLFDSLFGDIFRDLENELRGQSPLGKESQKLADEMSVATSKFDDLTNAIVGTTNALSGSSGSGAAFGGSSLLGFDNASYQQALSTISNDNSGSAGDGSVIEVTAKRPVAIQQQSITSLADKIAGATIDPIQKALSDVFGTSFAQMLGGVMKGALSGYLTGGATGGILGGLKGIVDQTGIFGGATGGLSGALGKAGGGAATGTQAAGIMKSLGLKTSTTGAQIGGAIGSFIPIPGGQIIGSIAGGLIGGLFKTNRTAGATVTNNGTVVAGKDKGNYETATGLGSSVLSGLNNIVDQLGGTLGAFKVTIGTRGDEYRVNTSGGSLKIKNGAVSFGDDQEAAIRYAIMDAINDGAVQGIRESTKNLLKAGDDLDEALQDALDWEGIFKELKQYKDPIGAAMDELNTEFEHYIELAKTAGATTQELADLEELYGIKRAEIIKEQAESLLGSLKSLYENLTVGDSGLSLRDRQANALTDYNALAARVAAGDTTAYDDYADAAQTLLDIERELYGSQQEYFDRLNEITALTKSQIDAQTSAIDAAENSDSPFDSTSAVTSSINSQTATLSSQLDAVNDNLGLISSQLAATGSTGVSWIARVKMASSF